jgi:hypothetical protein
VARREVWLLALAAGACTSPTERVPVDVPSQAPERPSAQLVVGRWLLVAEEPADEHAPSNRQERRLLELTADGRYRAENYVETREGTWRLEEDDLVLGDGRIRVESVDENTLVLIEDLPTLYLQGGSPRKMRNTYRRISESELGPMLGARVETSVPAAGTYAASYAYVMDKLPTMEIVISRQVTGHAAFELTQDGQAQACFSALERRRDAQSKYASPDGQHHSNEDQTHHVVGMSGTWRADATIVRVTADRSWTEGCTPPVGASTIGPVELECVSIAPNERLPAAALACRIVQGPTMLLDLAINPADTERAGPYTMQVEPRGRLLTDQGRPWLLLGSDTGLHVASRDGRRDRSPVVTFTLGAKEPPEAPRSP